MPLSNTSRSLEYSILRAAEDESKFLCQLKNGTKAAIELVPNGPIIANLVLFSLIVAVAAGVLIAAVRKSLGISIFGFASERASFRHVLCLKWLKMDQKWLTSTYGEVGMQYLIFQRHVLLLLLIVCIAATGVIMPVNFYMGHKYNGVFERITVSNLSSDSPWMWLHIVLAVLTVPSAVFIMKRYLTVIAPSVFDLSANRVLILEHLPEELRGNDLLRWLANKYPWCNVSRMYKTFPTRRLFALQSQVEVLKNILKDCGPETTLCCAGRNTAARGYYQEKLDRAEEDLRHELIVSQMQPLDIAFVVMKTRKMAKEIMEFESNELLADERIRVTIAPAVEDIEWRNMDYRKRALFKRWIFYIMLLLFMVFCTTPEYFVYLVDSLVKSKNETDYKSGSLRSLFITLTYGISKLFPFIMVASISHLGYYRQSNINHKILLQTGSYLVMAIVVAPFLAYLSIFNSIKLYFVTSTDAFQNATPNYWECNYTPQSTLFFVNYLLTSCLVGTVFDYLRGYQLLSLIGTLFTSKSWTEIRVLSTQESHFGLGEEYAWIILHVAITLSMVIANPLVAPIGLLYLLLKHVVDSVVLVDCRVKVKNVGKEFHVLAVSMVVYCAVLLQISNAIFLNIHTHHSSSYVSGFLAMLSPVLLLAHSHSEWLWAEPLRQPPTRHRPAIYKPLVHIKQRDVIEQDLDLSTESDE